MKISLNVVLDNKREYQFDIDPAAWLLCTAEDKVRLLIRISELADQAIRDMGGHSKIRPVGRLPR